MSRLADALFTTTQQKVLGLLYSSPERSFYTKQIIRTTGMDVATIKRELDRMLAAGIVSMTKLGLIETRGAGRGTYYVSDQGA